MDPVRKIIYKLIIFFVTTLVGVVIVNASYAQCTFELKSVNNVNTVCPGSSVTLRLIVRSTRSDANIHYKSIRWYRNGNFISSYNDKATVTVSNLQSTAEYSVRFNTDLILNDPVGPGPFPDPDNPPGPVVVGSCSSILRKTITVRHRPGPPSLPSTTNVCYGESATLAIANPSGSYTWLNANNQVVNPSRDGVQLSGAGNSRLIIPSATASRTFKVRQNNSHCTGDLRTVTVNVYPRVIVDAGPQLSVNLTISDAPITLTGNSPSGGRWSGAGVGANSNVFHPRQAGVGTHTITFTHTTSNGCLIFDTRRITVTDEGKVLDATERQILSDLFDDMDGPSWNVSSGWKQSANLNNWHGITFENLDVTAIDLPSNAVSGAIPDYLDQLLALERLNLGGNPAIQMPLPGSLRNLEHFTTLNLNECGLEGVIPGTITTYTNLRQLHLAGNNFTGEIPADFSNLSQLKVLMLGNNNLEGDISFWLKAFPNAIGLDFSKNNFVGYLPDEMRDLTELTALTLEENDLSGTIPDDLFEGMSRLVVLHLDHNHFYGPIPHSALKSSLQRLLLDHNEFSGNIADGSYDWNNLSNLYELRLGNNRLTGNILEYGWDFGGRLVELDLSHNRFYGNIVLPADMLNNAENINVSGNQFTSINARCTSSCLDLNLNIADNQLMLKDIIEGMGLSVGQNGNINDGEYNTNKLTLGPQNAALYFDRTRNTLFYTADFNYRGPQYRWFNNAVQVSTAQRELQIPKEENYQAYSSEISHVTVSGFVTRSLPVQAVDSANMYWAVADGNWTDKIWSHTKGGPLVNDYPKRSTDNVIIADHEVMLSNEVNCATLKLAAETDYTSLTVNNGRVTVYGDIVLTKERPELRGGLLVEEGGRVIPLGTPSP
ncbi:hypothetical protein FNH22_25530 [Fulvivirga sp. M361]|uniref:leucine-rich repeat domain-containing protein n=1 Tax=Fulvivirga sp. M361 TaxID=2594266 RepID=UPI001179CADE|nr:leucine-rich repeat domain-containing protein [Fulvivirga sp. M361]TRX50686.1 hypothetical protein FNH22_25530 [Fulvivirga sp. M361]